MPDSIEALLEKGGRRYTVASDWAEATDLGIEEHPDIVVGRAALSFLPENTPMRISFIAICTKDLLFQ